MAEIIIVGGGVAGLSAGIHARLQGHQVILLEKNLHTGGNLTAWKRNGCMIDNCIHWLTGTNPASSTYQLWKLLGAFTQTELIQKDSLFTIESNGNKIVLWHDIEKLAYELSNQFPGELKSIKLFITAVKAAQHIGNVGGKNQNSKNLFKIAQGVPALHHFYCRSAGQVAREIRAPALKIFFTALTGASFSSLGLIFATAAFCSGNGKIPRGGSYAMAMRITTRFTSLGGIVQTKTNATQVVGGKKPVVILESGERKSADYVIIAADPKNMLGPSPPKGFFTQTKQNAYYTFSALQAAFLCDTESLPFSGTLLLPMDYCCTGHLVLREFSHEPDFSPKGRSLLQAMVLVDEQTSFQWIAMKSQKETYLSEKAAFVLRIANIIRKRFPSLIGKMHCIDVWTPATYKNWTNAITGSFMAYTLPARKLPKMLSPKSPDSEHVLWATQWMQSPGGLPYAAIAGRRAAQMLPK